MISKHSTAASFVLVHAGRQVLRNLKELQELIWDAHPKYSNLGLHLGLDPNTIAAIQSSNNFQVDRCFTSVLLACIRKGITKEMVVEALSSADVGYNVLAEKVSKHNFS